jgi:hypothetical protein
MPTLLSATQFLIVQPFPAMMPLDWFPETEQSNTDVFWEQ